MRNTLFAATLLFAVPAGVGAVAAAADTKPASRSSQPPAPAPVTYQVWGFKWDGRQYVKQPNYSLATTDLNQAANYAAQFAGCPGWTVTTNLPPDAQHAPSKINLPPGILNMLCSLGIQPWQLRPSTDEVDDSTSSAAFTPTYGDTSEVDRMLATQDMLNRQQEFNNMQDMLNTQNMINSQNMVNNLQEMANTQNMLDQQNMINAMHSDP